MSETTSAGGCPYSIPATDESEECPWTLRCRNFSLRIPSISTCSDSVLALLAAFSLICGTNEENCSVVVSASTDLPATCCRRGIDVRRTWKLVNSAHNNSSTISPDLANMLPDPYAQHIQLVRLTATILLNHKAITLQPCKIIQRCFATISTENNAIIWLNDM